MLDTLRKQGPQTAGDLSHQLRLSSARVSSLLTALQTQGQVHSPRCVPGNRDNPVNLWEIRATGE
ncbi:hypothetical protein ACQAYK_12810 (plasmid) [Acidithiobacillus sp. AC3]